MKKVFTKFNMAIVLLIVVLFANVSFGAVDYRKIISELEKCVMLGQVTIKTPNTYLEDAPDTNVPYIAWDKNAINELETKLGVKINVTSTPMIGNLNLNDNGIIVEDSDGNKTAINLSLGYQNGDDFRNPDNNTEGLYAESPNVQLLLSDALKKEGGNLSNYIFTTFTQDSKAGSNWHDLVSFTNVEAKPVLQYMIGNEVVKKSYVKTGLKPTLSQDSGTGQQEVQPTIPSYEGEQISIAAQEGESGTETFEYQGLTLQKNYFTVGETAWYQGHIIGPSGSEVTMSMQYYQQLDVFKSDGTYIGSFRNEKRVLPLRQGEIYYFVTPSGEKGYSLSLEKLDYDTSTIGTYAEEEEASRIADLIEYTNNGDEPEWYEKVISWLIRLLGEGLNFIISKIAGEPLSIDKLVFDQYSKTNLSIFKSDYKYYQSKENPTGTNTLFVVDGNNSINVLNDVFNLFRNIAIVVYMVILVYMGLRILIMTANAQKKAKYKELIFDWIKGIVILFFFPYVIRYTVLLNHAFVTYLYKNIGDDSNLQGAVINSSNLELNQINEFKVSSGNNSGTENYMTQMYNTATSSRRISDAICWVIMLIQVIQFLIVYMKRLLTVIFLIAIFPLVTISYAVDKIGDGKSQAFNNWYKEFVLQVFVQSFHAVNYVLVMSIILGESSNWFLKIIGIGYIARGGDILRSLFAQMKGGAGRDGGPMEVAKAYMKTRLAIGGINTIKQSAGRVFSSDSVLGKGVARIQQGRDGLSYRNVLSAEKKANEAYRLHYEKQDKEDRINDVKNVTNGLDDLKQKRTAYNTQLSAPELSDEEKKRIKEEKEKVEEQINNYDETMKNSVDNLGRLSEDELKEAVDAAGITPEQVSQLQGALNYAGAVAILKNSRNEKNIDVRTAVDVVFKEKTVVSKTGTTGNRILDSYINATRAERRLSNRNIRKVNAAHSITIDDVARSVRTNIPEPVEMNARVDYALNMFKNAYMGEYGIDELTKNVDFIDTVKSNPTYESKIKQMEKDVGFSFEDFKLNLAVQTINDSNRTENLVSDDARERIDKAIELVQSADEKENKIILDGLNADKDELKKGYMPILKERENERSKVQKEISKTIQKTNMLGRYGEDYEEYLGKRIKETTIQSGKLIARGTADAAVGIAGEVVKDVAIGVPTVGVSTGATYTGGNDSKPVIVGVTGTMKTIDDISSKLVKAGTAVVDASPIKENTSPKVIRKSVEINKNDYFKNGAVNNAVDEEMKRRENLRNKMLNRKK